MVWRQSWIPILRLSVRGCYAVIQRLAYGLLLVCLGVALVAQAHAYTQLSALMRASISEGFLPPHRTPRAFSVGLPTPASRMVQGIRVRLPQDTVMVPNWSGWITALPRGDMVQSVSATFRIPRGLRPALSHASALGFWVGTGGAETPAILLQSGLFSYIYGGRTVPSQAVLEDCSSNAACLAHLRTEPLDPVRPGDAVTVQLRFVPWAGAASWFGFWMDTRVAVVRRHHVVQAWSGRMYLPPWATDQTSVEAVVEAMGNPRTGVLNALPNGDWHVPVRWSVRLQHPWPNSTWARTHLLHAVATGWYPRSGDVTHLRTTTLQVSSAGERGRGVISYDDGGNR